MPRPALPRPTLPRPRLPRTGVSRAAVAAAAVLLPAAVAAPAAGISTTRPAVVPAAALSVPTPAALSAPAPAAAGRDLRARRVVPVRHVARRASRAAARLPLEPRQIGRLLAAERGWTGPQWHCLDLLWQRESRWQVRARNASSGAYGIPQALPARRLAAAGPGWRTDAAVQVRWGLDYIADRYGDPCTAWEHSRVDGFY